VVEKCLGALVVKCIPIIVVLIGAPVNVREA